MSAMERHQAASQPSSAERRIDNAHREWIAGRAFTLLCHYWRDDDDEPLARALGRDWAKVLHGLPQDAIDAACIGYLRDEPRRKPTPGEIYRRAKLLTPAPPPVRLPPSARIEESKPDRCSPQEAQQIMEEYGFAVKRFGAGKGGGHAG